MATKVVTADNLRADAMDTMTNVSSIGGGAGAGVEPDITYQGGLSISRKVGTSQRGLSTSTGATRDMTAARRKTVLLKIAIGNWSSLLAQSSPGLEVYVGSSSSATRNYSTKLFSAYPAEGGFVVFAIDPNIAAHANTTTGSPTLTAMNYFGLQGNFSASSKGENVIMDAVDIGSGLNIVGGDGASPKGNFADFTAHDYGTVANRYGYVIGKGGILFTLGTLWIGRNTSQTAIATGFTSTGDTVVWSEGLFAAGYAGLGLDLGSASTAIVLDSCTFNGRGTAAGAADTRPILTVSGTSGTANISKCSFAKFASLTLTSATTATDLKLDTCGTVTSAGTNLRRSLFSKSPAASALIWNVATNPGTSGNLDNTHFVSAGTGHGIEFGTTSPTTLTLNDIEFEGYASGNGSTGNEAIWIKRTTGTVTINVVGGTTPSIRTAGATVSVNANPVTTTITVVDAITSAVIQNAQVYLVAGTGGPLTAGASIFNAATDVNGQVSESRTLSSNQPVTGRVRQGSNTPLYRSSAITATIDSSNGLNLTVLMIPDE